MSAGAALPRVKSIAGLWLVAMLIGPALPAAASCDDVPNLDDLRCAQGVDPATCQCLGAPSPPPPDSSGDPCQVPSSQVCIDSKLQQLAAYCAANGLNVRNNQDVATTWQGLWGVANDNNLSVAGLPAACR
jgi:hypothetical protein